MKTPSKLLNTRKDSMRKLRNISMISGSILMAMLALSPSTFAGTSTEGLIKNMPNVEWSKSGDKPFQLISTNQILGNEVNLIFIRPLDNDGLETSANIAVDGRFQVSLQPGHYSQVRYCSGNHNISIAPTGMKLNDLNTPYNHQVNFAAQQNHYIYVDIDDATGQPTLSKIDEAQAQNVLVTQTEQTHQISRIVANCPEIVEPEIEPEPVVKIEIDKPINLEVLFEFDKAVVQPVFNQQIEAVANFMGQYPNTSTIIEGHTDSIGAANYNMKLSQQRAEAVKQELVSKYGVNPNRLRTQGFGETRPVDTNATAEGRYNNRRVVATVNISQ